MNSKRQQVDILFLQSLNRVLENISKSCSKEEKLLNKELSIIKSELAKLNQRFEEKLK